MFQKILTTLSLVLILLVIPQLDKPVFAQAVSSCDSNSITGPFQYTVTGNSSRFTLTGTGATLPKETNAVYFRLTGNLKPASQYEAYIKWQGITTLLSGKSDGYTAPVIFNNSGDTIELAYDNTNDIQALFKNPGNSPYTVTLLEAPSGSSSFTQKCSIASFYVGQPVNTQPCNITLDKSAAAPGQDITASVSNVQLGAGNYQLIYSSPNGIDSVDKSKSPTKVSIDADGKGTFTFYAGQTFLTKARVTVVVQIPGAGGGPGAIPPDFSCSATFDIRNQAVPTGPTCIITPIQTTPYTVLDKPEVVATNLKAGISYWARLISRNLGEAKDLPDKVIAIDPSPKVTIKLSPTGYLPEGTYAVEIYTGAGDPTDKQCTTPDFTVGAPNPGPISGVPCPDPKRCVNGGGDNSCPNDNGPAIKTAIGCIHTSPVQFIKDFTTFIIGVSGGLAFLMMLLGAFQMVTSAGNPDTLHAGRERLTSAVIGLLFVIFAILLLQIIGVDILHLPGFGK